MRRIGLIAAGFLVGTGAQAQIQPQAFAALAFRQHPGAQLPLDAELRDEQGAATTLGRVLDHLPTVLVLEYLRCPNLCGLVLRGASMSVRKAGLAPGRDLELVGVSIDPRDGPGDASAARSMYSRLFRDPAAASAGVRFLTGDPRQVSRIAAAVGFPYRFDRGSGQFAHAAGFVVLTPEGRISRYVLGLNPSPKALHEAVEQASDGRITPPTHPLLCLCFGYDPDEGSVAALAWRLTRIVMAFAAVALGGLLLLLARRRSVR